MADTAIFGGSGRIDVRLERKDSPAALLSNLDQSVIGEPADPKNGATYRVLP